MNRLKNEKEQKTPQKPWKHTKTYNENNDGTVTITMKLNRHASVVLLKKCQKISKQHELT